MQDVLCTGASPAGAQGRRPGSPGPGASQPPQTPGKRWRAFALLTAACGYEGFPQGLAPLRTGNMTTGGKAMTTRNDQMTSFTYTTYIRAPGPASTIPSAVALTPETSRPGVREPGHEQPELAGARLPGAVRPGAPAQEQRDRVRVALRRRLRAVAAEPHLPQEAISDRHDGQVLIEHRPVPRAGRQPYQERPHPSIPRSRAGLHELLPATSATPGETRRATPSHDWFTQRHATGQGP